MKSSSRRLRSSLGLFLLLAGGVAGLAQVPALKSTEANPDQSVTFRYFSPTAREVTLSLDYDHHPLPLKKGDDGVWTLTTAPLQAAVHMYSLTVDGVGILDPLNPSIDRNFVFLTNKVRVFKPTPQPWDVTDVPHGVVHHHMYRSGIILGLKDAMEDFYVYTPPGYDAAGAARYPVLYLLHGWSSLADSWLEGGQANLILDNLLAQGAVRPMVVVMPQGYGDMSFVLKGFDQWNDEAKIANNLGLFSNALLTEIMPQVESGYRVRAGREDRAIAGLSMGGGESLVIGLNHPDKFAWIGGFSSAVTYGSFDGVFPDLASGRGRPPDLLWVACGTGDDLIAAHRKFVAWLKAKGADPTVIETPGIHNWPVWRDNLIHLAPLLFRERT
jgi:enterochelin esterase family protein